METKDTKETVDTDETIETENTGGNTESLPMSTLINFNKNGKSKSKHKSMIWKDCDENVVVFIEKEFIQLQKNSIQYLGALFNADGCIQRELNKRIGMATSNFEMLRDSL